MPRLPPDQGQLSGRAFPEASRIALRTALLEHRSALVALASSVCDVARELHANGGTREDILVAVRELVGECRTLTASVLEEEGDGDVLDAMVESCLDEWAASE